MNDLDLAHVLWADGRRSGWRTGGEPTSRHIANPCADDPRQLIPWHVSSVPAAWHRVSDDATWLDRLRTTAGTAMLVATGPVLPRRRHVVRATGSLFEEVGQQLGFGTVHANVLCGPPRANRKPVVQLVDRRGRPLAYVKVAWNDLTRDLLVDEARSLAFLDRIPDRGFDVPTVMAQGEFGSASWLALSPVRVARRIDADQATIDDVARSIEATADTWRGALAVSPFVADLMPRARDLPMSGEGLERMLARRADEEIVLCGSHGDFVPWNTLAGRPRTAVWDWERYRADRPRGYDRFHHRLQVGIHRRSRSIRDAVDELGGGPVARELGQDHVDLHVDAYVLDLLCRYESDSRDQPTARLLELVTGLWTVLKERLPR